MNKTLEALARGTPGAELHDWRKLPLKASLELSLDDARIDKVSVAGNVDLVVAAGPAALVFAGPEEDLLRRIQQFRILGTLRLELPAAPGSEEASSTGTMPRVVIGLRLPVIPNITHEGHGDVFVYGAQQEELFLSHQGQGTVTGFGEVAGVAAVLGGAANMHLERLLAKHAIATQDGSGSLELRATASVTARLSGTGTILVHGKPTRLSETVSGTGTIECL